MAAEAARIDYRPNQAARRLRAGRNISLIGYDNLSVAAYADPPLTTIAQPIDRAACWMVEMPLSLLAGGTVAGLQELWPAELIARASDGPVAPATRPKTPRRKAEHDQKNFLRP